MAKYCTNCGCALRDGAKFCQECGSAVTPVPAPEPTPRPQSAPAPQPTPGLSPTPRPQPAPAPQPAPEPSPAPKPHPMPVRECGRCRARLDPDAVFCEVCGTPVQGGTPIAPSAQPVRQIPPAQPVQKRSHTGLIVVCAILLLASVGSGIFLAGGIRAYRDAGSTDSTAAVSGQGLSLFGGGQKQDAGAALLPDGAELRRDATAGDVKGVWSGSFTFDVLEGLADMEGAPADIDERVAQIKATPAAMTIELGDGGQWSLELDAMGGFDMRERDLKSESRPDGIPWTGPTDGVMTVDSGTFDEGGAKGSMKLEMAAGTDAQGALLGGQFSVTMENGVVQVEMQGHFTLRPDHEEQEGS